MAIQPYGIGDNTMTPFQETAQQLHDSIVHETRTDGTQYYGLDKETSKLADWRWEAVHDAHMDRLPSDDIYQVIAEVAELLADCDDQEEAAERIAEEVSADVYTVDLTAWLASHLGNVAYLDQYKEEYGDGDSYALLYGAQYLWKQEIAHSILCSIRQQVEGGTIRTRKARDGWLAPC
jgi:hypothetical protein